MPTKCFKCENACKQLNPYTFDEVKLANEYNIFLCEACLARFRAILKSDEASKDLPRPLHTIMEFTDTGVSLVVDDANDLESAQTYLDLVFNNAVTILQNQKQTEETHQLFSSIEDFLRRNKK